MCFRYVRFGNVHIGEKSAKIYQVFAKREYDFRLFVLTDYCPDFKLFHLSVN